MDNLRVAQVEPDSHTADLLCELVGMIVLKMDRQRQARSQWQGESIVSAHRCKIEDVSDLHVEHDHLVTESSTLLNKQSDLTVLVKGSNSLGVHKLYDGALGLLVAVRVRRVVEHALLAVAKLEARLLVGLDLGCCLGRHEVQVGLFLTFDRVLWHLDHESIGDLQIDRSREPITLPSVLLRILYGDLASHECLTFLLALCVNRRAVEGCEEVDLSVSLVVSHIATGHDKVCRDAVNLG